MKTNEINISQLVFLKHFLESDIQFVDTEDIDYCNDSLHYTMLITDRLENDTVITAINDILSSDEYNSQPNRYKAILNYINKIIDSLTE